MIKVLVVFGTRPEAIKMAPLVLEMKKFPNLIHPMVCVTGQHRDMLDQVLTIFEIVPDYDLEIMKPNQDLFDIFTNTMIGMRDVLTKTKPDFVLVHGDTSTSSAAALSAFYFKIPVGHVEAGLRTYERYNPWPEEINRQMNSKISTFHFAPTQSSAQNLRKELVSEESIVVTGNTVIDALKIADQKISDLLKTNALFFKDYFPKISMDTIEKWISGDRKMVLITAHRRENFGEGFKNIFQAINELVDEFPQVDFVFPLHLNPKVREAANEIFGDGRANVTNLFFEEPMGYLSFVFLLRYSHLVLTDSGGIQEEAPGFGKPVLVLRDTTERPEAVESGTVILVGTDSKKIKESVSLLINDSKAYQSMSHAINPYGDGLASSRIVSKILEISSTS